MPRSRDIRVWWHSVIMATMSAMAVSAVQPRFGWTTSERRSPGPLPEAVDTVPADRAVALATSGLIAYVLLTSAWFVQVFVTLRSGPASRVADLVGLSVSLPLLVGVLLSAVRENTSRALRWLLAGLVVAFAAIAPAAGVAWLFFAQFVAGAILVSLPFRSALPLFVAVVLVVVPVTRAEHQQQWSTYMTLKTLEGGLCLAIAVTLVRTLRHHQLARVELARQAVIAERLRIDEVLAADISAALGHIVSSGERAITENDVCRLAEQLAVLVAFSRQTLTSTRRQLASYQDPSAVAELATAVSLLRAAGVQAHLELPTAGAPDTLDARLRAELRTALQQVLGKDVSGCVITLAEADCPARPQLSITAVRKSGSGQR